MRGISARAIFPYYGTQRETVGGGGRGEHLGNLRKESLRHCPPEGLERATANVVHAGLTNVSQVGAFTGPAPPRHSSHTDDTRASSYPRT